jgi:hypothetical protein
MLSRSHHPLRHHTAALLSPPVAPTSRRQVSQNPLCQPAAPQHPQLFCSLHLGAAQVLDKNEPQYEPEQFIEKPWLTEPQKPNLSNSLKTKDRVLARFFIENEPEYFAENKQH